MGLAAIVLVSLTACTISIPSTPAPTVAPTLSGEQSASPGRLRSVPDLPSPVELGKRELMDANVTEVCALDEPPTWCRYLLRSGGASGTRVAASSYYVSTDLPTSDAGEKIGTEMCRDIADRTLDRDGQPIGVYRVVILNGGLRNLAECDAP